MVKGVQFELAILVFLVIGVFFEIHGSSIGIYSVVLNTPDDVILGTNRLIRSDEWLVNTPLAFSQYYNDFGYYSSIVRGYPTDMFMVYGQAVKDFAVIFRPTQWGYLIFNPAKGLSFFWISRLVFLFLISFEMGMLICKKNKLLSLTYAVFMCFSPLVQWWFAVNSLAEILIFGQAGILVSKLYLESATYKYKVLYAVGLVWIVGVYIFSIYPAWQVSCAYLFLAILGWIIYDMRKRIFFTAKDAPLLIVMCGLLIMAIVPILAHSDEVIQIVRNTVYPGQRYCVGGEFTLSQISYIFNYALSLWLPVKDLTGFTNNCEAARMFDLAPLGIIISCFCLIRNKKKDLLLIILLGLQVVFFSWLFIQFPAVIAKITLFNNVTASRLLLPFGIINFILLLRTLAIYEQPFTWNAILILAILESGISTYFAYVFYPMIFSYQYIIATVIIIFLIVVVIIKRDLKYFSYFMIIVLLFAGGRVNPVAKGTKSIYQSNIIKQVQSIAAKDKGLWLVAGNGVPLNITIMGGAPTVNSINTYPVLERWHQFDPEGQKRDVYNRYAHIPCSLQGSEKTSMQFVQLDVFHLYLQVNDLKKLEIKYVLTNEPCEALNTDAVKFTRLFQDASLMIFRIDYL